MGTNYYWVQDAEENNGGCAQCTPGAEYFHIGKSSAGWCFSLHVIPEKQIHSLEHWKVFWKMNSEDGHIEDEYGNFVSIAEMLKCITNRKSERALEPCPFYVHPYSRYEIGPNNLMRHPILEHHCIGHGEGTWDLIEGDFS